MEEAPDAAIYAARFSDREGKWSEPKMLASTLGRPEGNLVLFSDPRERVGSSMSTCREVDGTPAASSKSPWTKATLGGPLSPSGRSPAG